MDKSPQLGTDGLGNWIAVWASSEDVAGSGSDTDILFATSTDQGRSWSAPLPLNANASTDTGADEMPRIETDRKGRWIVIWQSFENLGATTGTDGDILVSTSINLGNTWSAPQPLNSNATTDSNPDSDPAIHYASNGHWVVAWSGSGSSGSGTDSDIFHSRSSDGGITWSPLSALNDNATTDEGMDSAVSLAADGQGNWVAVWSSIDDLPGVQDGDSDLLFSRSSNNGSSWTPPAFVRADAMSDRLEDFGPQLRTDRSGTWVVVWESGDDLGGTIGTDQNILVVRSTDNGLTWSPPSVVNQNAYIDSALDSFPSLATDESGAWFCVWSTGGSSTPGRWGADRDLVSSYSVDGGITWSSPAVVAANAGGDSGEDLFPAVLTDRSGTWLVTWQTDDPLGGSIRTDGDILAVSLEHPTFWAEPVFLNTDFSSDDRSDSAPQLATDGVGDWVAIWAGTKTNQSDMYFSRSEDNALSWTVPSLFTPAATALGGTDPTLATDGNGVWIAVWTLNGIMFSRSTDNGFTWSMPALIAPRQQGDADFAPSIATDHVGNWVLVWGAQRDSLGGDFDLLSSHSMDNGATWETLIPLKVNASSDLGDDFEPRVATDGNGRWIAVWASNDSLNDTIGRDDDILVAYSLNSGASWSVEQPFNSNAATDQMMEDDFTPQITTDRQGNWLVAWHSKGALNNTLGDDYDILYTRSGDHGVTWSPVAPLHATAVGDAATDQFVRLGVNGIGEWLAVWHSDHPFLGGDNDPSDSEFDLLVSRSSDAGVTWSFPSALNPNATVDSEFNPAANLTPALGGQWMLGTAASSLLAGGDAEPAFFSLRQPLLAATATAAVNGAGLQIANAAITGGNLSLQWNGGSPPFVVQSTSSLGQPGGVAPVWSTLLTTCSFSAVAPVSGQQAFFRVLQSPASGGPVLGWVGDTEYTHAGATKAVASTFFVPGFGLDADVHVLTSGDLPLTLQKTIINTGGQAVNGGYPAQVEVRGMTFLAVGGSAGYVPGSDLQIAFDCSTTATPSLRPGQMGSIEFTLGGATCAPTLPLSALPCGLYQVTVNTTIPLTGPCGEPGATVTLSDRDFIFVQGPNRVQMAVVQNPNNVRAPAGPPFPNVAICPPNVVGVWPSETLPSVQETAATHQVTISTAPDATAPYFVRAKSPVFGQNGVAQGDLVPLPPQAPNPPLLASGPGSTVLTLNLTTPSGLHGTMGCNSFCGPLIFWDTVNVTITAITTDGCSIAQETLQAAGIYECDSLKLGFP